MLRLLNARPAFVALGPAIGGVRIRPDITADEVARLARAMTIKNALAGLPHGGGKAGLAAPGLGAAGHERVMRAFARAMRQLTDYIPGPDMGTSETPAVPGSPPAANGDVRPYGTGAGPATL